jgi:hypothetical protein
MGYDDEQLHIIARDIKKSYKLYMCPPDIDDLFLRLIAAEQEREAKIKQEHRDGSVTVYNYSLNTCDSLTHFEALRALERAMNLAVYRLTGCECRIRANSSPFSAVIEVCSLLIIFIYCLSV